MNALVPLVVGAGLVLGAIVGLICELREDKPQEVFEHADAVALAKGGKFATLATDHNGTPFASLTPYALDEDGSPFIYVSNLAVHTKNLKAKPEGSLMVAKEDEKNVFNSARITLVGKLELVSDKGEVARLRKIYFVKYSQAEDFDKVHGFVFYKMKVDKIHYVGGFGDIRWISGEDWGKGYR